MPSNLSKPREPTTNPSLFERIVASRLFWVLLISVNLGGGVGNLINDRPWTGALGVFFAGLGIGWASAKAIIDGYEQMVDEQQDFIDHRLEEMTQQLRAVQTERMNSREENPLLTPKVH